MQSQWIHPCDMTSVQWALVYVAWKKLMLSLWFPSVTTTSVQGALFDSAREKLTFDQGSIPQESSLAKEIKQYQACIHTFLCIHVRILSRIPFPAWRKLHSRHSNYLALRLFSKPFLFFSFLFSSLPSPQQFTWCQSTKYAGCLSSLWCYRGSSQEERHFVLLVQNLIHWATDLSV